MGHFSVPFNAEPRPGDPTQPLDSNNLRILAFWKRGGYHRTLILSFQRRIRGGGGEGCIVSYHVVVDGQGQGKQQQHEEGEVVQHQQNNNGVNV